MSLGSGIQVDDGEFTRIHNSILDKLALARFTASEYRCLMFLFRMTYGWQKKEDVISLSQWCKGVGIDPEKRHNVLRTLQALTAKRVIYCKSNGNNHAATWGFNKHFDEWDASLFEETVITQDNTHETPVIKPHNTSVISPDNTTVIPEDNTSVISRDNHKRKKERLKKIKESVAAQPTPQQEMFGAVCEAIGWDYKTLSKDDKGQIAQAVGILQNANYSADDIRHFITDFWFKDWRWTKEGKPPTLKQLRQEIGIIRSMLNGVGPPVAKKGINGYREMLAEQGIEL